MIQDEFRKLFLSYKEEMTKEKEELMSGRERNIN